MPLSLRRGVVTAVVEEVADLIRLEVDGVPCVAYPGLTGLVEVGDDVVVNVQARELGLGSGGFDVLYANLTRGLELAGAAGAHVTVLPYTPIQHAVRHVEEDGPLADGLGGLPVVCCTLHSQVAPACAALAGARVAYVQIPGGALPVALSDTVRALRARGLVEHSLGVGPCFGGDLQAVSTVSALAWAAAAGFQAVVCAVGPGIVGTGSRFGHGGLNAAHAANATAARDGSSILAVRVSHADPRERHQGVSHHTRAVLELCDERVAVAWPAGLEVPDGVGRIEEVDVEGWREACDGLPLEHMGRGPEDDPWFFASAFAAGRLARQRVP
jgi:hypothetical protein